MSTLYELFKVNENATQDEIKEAYDKIISKANSLPQNDKIIEKIRRIKIAYGILSNPEKRKKYDIDLASKRADELLKNVQVKKSISEEINKDANEDGNIIFKKSENNNIEEKIEDIQSIDEQRIKQVIDQQINNVIKNNNVRELKEKLDKQRKEKQLKEEKIRKQAKKQEKRNRRQAKKEQQLKREMEIQAYGEYLSKQGYKVKYPWTWLRIKRLLITIIAVIIALFILWQIPFIRNTLTDLYRENFVVKFLVDMIISILNWIIESIKSIFK